MTLAAVCAFFFLLTLSNALFWPALTRRRLVAQGAVTVLIPARDEAANLPACLEHVLRQGSCVREVLVYDDHSSDDTPRLLEAYVARPDSRIRAVRSEPLPPGWCGKNFACDRLAAAAEGEWLLFLDADARLLDHAIVRMLAEAQARRLTMLSCWPGIVMRSPWEKLLMPMLNFVVFSLFPGVLSLRRQQPSLGLAHGACLLLERRAYQRTGGHAAVRGEIFEDTRLAQLWRARGERAWCVDGQSAVRVRMYGSFDAIWRGFQKNFYPAFRHEITFWLFWTFHAVVFLAPFLLGNWLAVLFVLGARGVLAMRFRHSAWSVLAHPLCEGVTLALALSSRRLCRTGQGVAWKGRVYRAS